MKLEIETKYEIGQKVYVADHGFTIEFLAREVEIMGIVIRHGLFCGRPKQYVSYVVSPRTGTYGNEVIEFAVYATEAEAQAKADRLNEELGEEGGNGNG